jgi:hypothetical protein
MVSILSFLTFLFSPLKFPFFLFFFPTSENYHFGAISVERRQNSKTKRIIRLTHQEEILFFFWSEWVVNQVAMREETNISAKEFSSKFETQLPFPLFVDRSLFSHFSSLHSTLTTCLTTTTLPSKSPITN